MPRVHFQAVCVKQNKAIFHQGRQKKAISSWSLVFFVQLQIHDTQSFSVLFFHSKDLRDSITAAVKRQSSYKKLNFVIEARR
jgi:hypothetical protein